jgi:hypothetical protein
LFNLSSLGNVQVIQIFSTFLKEGKEFYCKLASQLQEVYGSNGVCEIVAPELAPGPGKTPREVRDIRISLFRCLICLGDLTRCLPNLHDGLLDDSWSAVPFFD